MKEGAEGRVASKGRYANPQSLGLWAIGQEEAPAVVGGNLSANKILLEELTGERELIGSQRVSRSTSAAGVFQGGFQGGGWANNRRT